MCHDPASGTSRVHHQPLQIYKVILLKRDRAMLTNERPAGEISRSEFAVSVRRKPRTLSALSQRRFGADSGSSRER